MTGVDGLEFEGVANVGIRPTVDGGSTVILETYLFDFDKEIYGRYVEVHFKQKIRDEVRFQSLEQLKAQIEKDVVDAKKFFEIKRLWRRIIKKHWIYRIPVSLWKAIWRNANRNA